MLKRTLRFLAVIHVRVVDPAYTEEEVERQIPDHLTDAVTALESGKVCPGPFHVTSIDTILYARTEKGEE